ncbi:MAG: cyclase family protein [Candidatus Babeliales bacterium]
MTIVDISWPISTVTTGYKDKKVVNFTEVKEFNKDGARETTITVSSHTGTHVDAPSHFLKDGKTIDQIQLERLMGQAVVLDLTDVTDAITREHLLVHDAIINEHDIVLLKTANSNTQPTEPFTPHFIYLHISGARYLAEKQIKAVGIDYLGIERSQPDHETHVELFTHDVVIIEGLRLGHVHPGRYEFYCLPLNIIGLEAAPARAILVE